MIRTNWTQRSSDLGIQLQEGEGSLRVEVSSTAADQIYYRNDGDSITVTDDLRQLVSPTDTLDERAIYSLLQFGAVIPPLSPWKPIRRAVPGRITTFRGHPARAEESEFTSEKKWGLQSGSLNPDEQISVLIDTLDSLLLKFRHRNRLIILFSGGVDSGLLAARAAALGLKDTLLVNYCFGPEDSESILAEQMAKHLGLSFQRIQSVGPGMGAEDLLANAGSDYRAPFCDSSTVPTYRLVKSVIRTFGPEYCVLDGTGADGGFGLSGRSRQWRRLHSIPSGLLRAGAIGYRLLRSWRKSTHVEHRLRLLRRACQHPFPLSAIAQNPLAGIAYHVPKQASLEVESLALSWLQSISPQDPQLQFAALDVSLVCSCIFAQKSKSLFADSDFDVAYPYLSPLTMRLALTSGYGRGAGREAKWLLKAALARHVPSGMVYRPKSSFVAPMSEAFSSDAFLAAFDNLIGKSQLSPFLDKKFFQDIRGRLAAKRSLAPQTAHLVWAMVFVSEWLEQVAASRISRSTLTAGAGIA